MSQGRLSSLATSASLTSNKRKKYNNMTKKTNKKAYLVLYKWAEDTANNNQGAHLFEAVDKIDANKVAMKHLEQFKSNFCKKNPNGTLTLAEQPQIIEFKDRTYIKYRTDSQILKKLLIAHPELKKEIR